MKTQSYVWHPNTQMSEWSKFPKIVRGEGMWLIDEDGNRFLDGVASMWCNVWGHSKKELINAIIKQTKKLQHSSSFNFTNEPVEILAKKLVKLSPNMTNVFFSDNGSTAMEVAIKIALQYWKNHNIKNIAVVEKGWIGGGNAGRNTTIIRSNYMMPGYHQYYEHSLKLWENLSHELNYNVMFSQRAHISLFHSPAARDAAARRYNIMSLNGTEAELWNLDQLKKNIPHLNYEDARFPIIGAAVQRRAGNARHDSVAWGYARAADQLGVDILQNCEVRGVKRNNGRIEHLETSRGLIKAK